MKFFLSLAVIVTVLVGGVRPADAIVFPWAYVPYATLDPSCDADFFRTVQARAWSGAQRELSQFENLIAKSDSTLSFCFGPFMNHLSWYAERSFPGNPQESQGGYSLYIAALGITLPALGGFATDAKVALMKLLGNVDPVLTEGLDMNRVLEILILDTLVDGVSDESNPLALINYSFDDFAAMACGLTGSGPPRSPYKGKGYYIENNFGRMFLGDRAALSALPSSSVSDSVFNCSMMNRVWTLAKCYDFMSDVNSARDVTHPENHDGFYWFSDYVKRENDLVDYREHVINCYNSDDEVPHMICEALAFHGIPSLDITSLGLPWMFWPWNNAAAVMPTTWSHSYNMAFPPPGGSGAMDPATTFLNLMRTSAAACSAVTPIKTGLKVERTTGSPYDDAVCPAPGCWYDNTTGTCKP